MTPHPHLALLDIVDGSVPGSRSLVSVDRPGVSIEAVKKADTEEAILVRLCEVAGGRGPVSVTVDAPFSNAARTDLLERATDELPIDGRTVTLALRPFELLTLILR